MCMKHGVLSCRDTTVAKTRLRSCVARTVIWHSNCTRSGSTLRATVCCCRWSLKPWRVSVSCSFDVWFTLQQHIVTIVLIYQLQQAWNVMAYFMLFLLFLSLFFCISFKDKHWKWCLYEISIIMVIKGILADINHPPIASTLMISIDTCAHLF